ncbi:hypothetical protein PNA2_0548 [Pyrococcus sp. NA2]|uniref:tetratricopeptide repeat protein n=1 Tax=Pyrococcus sp. (strain NA2) TaxID=342949 RepID=UPI000209AB4E|nr:tetratricopeptide repeat protein [Pyrococcus sp. NA2]AEC51464.1 hypothetical protein PNA2_0548 [Pyrococcus sp. NA2]
MKEWETALKEKDCQKLLELFDEYFETIEEEKLEEELERVGKVAVECENFDLLHEIAHLYDHLGEPEKGIELYKTVAEKRKERDLDEYAEALYYLADAYDHFGMPKEALKVYEELLKIEEKLNNKREVALTLANMAIIKDELGQTDEAIKLMEKAKDIFQEVSDERNYLISLIDLAHFNYRLGKYGEAKELIKEVLRNPVDREIEVNSRIVESEIYSGEGKYKEAALSLRDALQRAEDDEELFGLVFDTIIDFIEGLLNEGKYNQVIEVSKVFSELFEDDTRYFFEAIGKIAEWKSGKEDAKIEVDELYKKIENEDLRAILDEWRKPKLTLSLI